MKYHDKDRQLNKSNILSWYYYDKKYIMKYYDT